MKPTKSKIPSETTICFRERELKGSRLRCLHLTSKSRETVGEFLENLVAPHAVLDSVSDWLPQGLLTPGEVNLDRKYAQEFLTDEQREELAGWWLINRGGTTPTWDIVAKCSIEGRSGLIVVEAKAHGTELGTRDACTAEDAENRRQIADAIRKANEGLSHALAGWCLQRDSHFQLSNRFALSWKIASMGVPVILVYLGFLDAWDMNEGARTILKSAEQWHDCILRYADRFVPKNAWETRLDVAGTPLIPLIRAARVEVSAECCLTSP